METLLDAIREGKRRFIEENPGHESEEVMIRYAVAEFIWKEFKACDMEDCVRVLDAVVRITK